jgi:hypothetical protein
VNVKLIFMAFLKKKVIKREREEDEEKKGAQ